MIPLVIAQNTFREASRDRVLSGAIAAGMALLIGTQFLAPLALGEGLRLTIDLGLTGISVLGMVVIIMTGTSMVSKEIEKKTIYNLLSRPIARYEYLIGKWAGLAATLWVVAGALGLGLWGVLAFRGYADHANAIFQACYFAGLELSVITSVAVLFSALSTPVLSAMYTLAMFALGQWSYDIRELAAHFPGGVRGTLDLAANLVPNLPLFNIRTLAAAGLTPSPVQLGVASLYAVVYIACALALATAAFETRDFK